MTKAMGNAADSSKVAVQGNSIHLIFVDALPVAVIVDFIIGLALVPWVARWWNDMNRGRRSCWRPSPLIFLSSCAFFRRVSLLPWRIAVPHTYEDGHDLRSCLPDRGGACLQRDVALAGKLGQRCGIRLECLEIAVVQCLRGVYLGRLVCGADRSISSRVPPDQPVARGDGRAQLSPYRLHLAIVIGLQSGMAELALPALAKFTLATMIGVALAFGSGHCVAARARREDTPQFHACGAREMLFGA